MKPEDDLIYFDNNATTRIDPAVLEAMLPWLTSAYGNPSSACRPGAQAAAAIARAREQVAALLQCEPREIVFTSGGTESNHAAIFSALQGDPNRRRLVTTRVEHSAITRHAEALAKRGCEVTWLGVNQAGQLDLAELESAIGPDTAVISIMWANNETGVLSDVPQIAELVRSKGTLFHTDAVQAVGKVPIDLAGSKINFLSASAHKFHGPKGVGVLYVNRRTRFYPMFQGGSQENSRRAGTENVAGIVGTGAAAELAMRFLAEESARVRALRDHFETGVLERIPGAEVNGDPANRLPNTSNLAFPGVESEGLLMLLDRAGICCSAGSACTAGSLHASHVLRGMGYSTERARGSLRFSFSRFSTGKEVARVLELLPGIVAKVRGGR